MPKRGNHFSHVASLCMAKREKIHSVISRDIAVLNAAAAIIVAGVADNFRTAIELAKDSIDEGRAGSCLEKLIKISNSGK